MDSGTLERRLFPVEDSPARPVPDWSKIKQELARPGVTLQLLWSEYKEVQPDGYQYSRFCELYGAWRGKLDLSMRQDHKAGEKLFVDYSGMRMSVPDPRTGEERPAEIFETVLGASNYCYAEATWTQSLPDWVGSHVRTFEFFSLGELNGAIRKLLGVDGAGLAPRQRCALTAGDSSNQENLTMRSQET